MKHFLKILTIVVLSFSLVHCAGITTAVSKRDLVTENKMSNTIFLEPTAEENQTVYLQVRNTTDIPALNIAESVKTDLRMKGYQIVSDPKKAQYLLQVNVLSAGEIDPQTRDDLVASGFGGAISGGVLGAGTAAVFGGHSSAVIGGALAGAAIGALVDSTVKDVTYGVTTDIQISERTPGSIVTKTSQGKLKQGSDTTVLTTQQSQDNWQRYQTRVVSTANKVNLSWDEAGPVLAQGLSKTVAGMF